MPDSLQKHQRNSRLEQRKSLNNVNYDGAVRCNDAWQHKWQQPNNSQS